MSDLVALVLKLCPAQGQPARDLSAAAQAWFLAEVARLDPALAEQLHQGAHVRPYAIWQSWQPTPFLRVTSIAPALSAFLLDRWLPALPGWIRLDNITLEIAGIAMQSDSHPWAGRARYADLVQGRGAGRGGAGEQGSGGITLEFVTPTLFRSDGLDVPLPVPALIFDGLIQKWRQFAPVPLDPDLKAWIQAHLAVNRYDLHTQLIRFGGDDSRDAMGGFVGRCRFSFVNDSPDCPQAAQCRALAYFAFYAGVGRRTTMGLGQCRVRGS